MSRLITNSLISSIDWFNKAYTQYREKAYNDLKNMLSRIWSKPSPAITRGIVFEKMVYELLTDKNIGIDGMKCSNEFKEVLWECNGGKFQTKCKNYITVDGQEYCLYGKIDVQFPETILDIKTTMRFNASKYRDSFQHKIYMVNTGIQRFVYLVVIFYGNSTTIKAIKKIEVLAEPETLIKYKSDIVHKIKEIEKFFDNYRELKVLYEEKYSLY